MAQILDYSAGYPGARAVRNANYAGVIRYLRKEGASSVKPITKIELDDMMGDGRTVALVYQHVSRSRVTRGLAAGRHDAEWALARALELGIGTPPAIYFAVDYDAPASDFAAIGDYHRGAALALGVERVGTYGKYTLLDYLFKQGLTTWGWQTYAWSPGHNHDDQSRHPRAHLFQRLAKITVNGVDCDVNDVLKVNYGQIGEEDVSAAEVWGMKRTWTPPGATKPVTVSYGDLALWDNYYSGYAAVTIDKLLALIAANETNDLTIEQLRALHQENMDEIREALEHATIDVDVTVGGKAVPPTEGTP